MSAIQKEIKTYFTQLDNFYKKKNGPHLFRKWLDLLKTYNITDNKVPNLLNNSKIQVETQQETGKYNLILQWIIKNKDEFLDYDFTGIPESNFIDIEQEMQSNGAAKTTKKQFKTVEDVGKWCKNPTIHPITDEEMNPMSEEYDTIFRQAFKILKKKYNDDLKTLDNLPKIHLLFNKYDFIYYDLKGKSNIGEIPEHPHIFEILIEDIQNLKSKTTHLETELEILRNRFSDDNLNNIKTNFEKFIKHIMRKLVDSSFVFKRHKIDFITQLQFYEYKPLIELVKFFENEKLSNGRLILVYLTHLRNGSGSSSSLKWIQDLFDVYYDYKNFYNDVRDLIEPDLSVSNPIVDNYENKQFKIIEDPLEKYFKPYTDKLKPLIDTKFTRLINLETYTPISSNNYLNDKQFGEFTAEYNKKLAKYNKDNEEYKKDYDKKKTEGKSSPTPPSKFTIQLPNGIYRYPMTKPLHISDKVVKEFNEIYVNLESSVKEYNKIKDMSYKKLVKSSSSTSGSGSGLLKMSRQDIQDNILYDPSESFKNKCNDDKDILTQEEFNDENYPLAKLQLMVRLKIKFGDKYKTECIYAPNLYNHLVNSVNTKTPFINPVTRIKYTDEHIEQLMKVMHIIDKDLENPKFLKPTNDTKLKLEVRVLPDDPHYLADMQRSYDGILKFYSVDVYRKFGNTNYRIYNICTIPVNIGNERDDLIKTGSNDVASSVMITHIYKLFYEGRLLCNYVPPYHNLINNYYKQYIDLGIHFNRYKYMKDWIYELDHFEYPTTIKSKDEVLRMFVLYLDEIKNFIYH